QRRVRSVDGTVKHGDKNARIAQSVLPKTAWVGAGGKPRIEARSADDADREFCRSLQRQRGGVAGNHRQSSRIGQSNLGRPFGSTLLISSMSHCKHHFG